MQNQPNKSLSHFNNHQQQPLEQQSSVQQVMTQLQQLSQKIQNNPQYPLGYLKDYVTLYVQNHNRSQQFFNLMCEHNMLAKLFSGVSRPIFILQIFNLLLANTQQISELVYVFSHPLFHNYLLINFQVIYQGNSSVNTTNNATTASSQCIEYYIQLLKTIVTKLQSDSHQCTLLKLFCNSKYSSFPLLTNCIVLAIKRNIKQELVRVTAQHCILQLIGIMANKKVGEYYFSNIHMLIFFYQIITEMVNQETVESNQKDTTIKYVIDLLKAVSSSNADKQKQKSFLLFFTLLNNILVFKFIKNPAPALHLLFKLSNLFSQTQEIRDMVSKYLTSIYFIFGKYLFNKYLNNISLSSIILICEDISQLSELKQVNILKIIKSHYQKLPLMGTQIQRLSASFTDQQTQKKEENQKKQEENNKSYRNSQHYQTPRKSRRLQGERQSIIISPYEGILKELQKYNLDNPQFYELKQSYHKKSTTTNNNWFFNFNSLFKKINVFDLATSEYIKKLAHLASVKYINQRAINFMDQIFAPTAVYVYEYLRLSTKQTYLFGQRTEDTQKIQVSFNENRDQFLIGKQFFKILINITELALCEIDSIAQHLQRGELFNDLQKKYNKKLSHPGEIYFILHFRQYFQHSIAQFVCSSPNNKPRNVLNSSIVKLVYKFFHFLQPAISQMNKTKIQTQILKLQKQLIAIQKQKEFQSFREYLQSQKEKKMVQESYKSDMQTSVIRFDKKQSNSPSSKKGNVKKKKSIFRSFKKQQDNSPSKGSLATSLKSNQTSKLVQLKMLHLELLRYIVDRQYSLMNNSYNSQLNALKRRQSLYKIFQRKFVQKYASMLSQKPSKRQSVIYEASGIRFNQQDNCQCSVILRVSFEDYTIYTELLHENKLILRCDIKQFNLSKNFSLSEQNIKIQQKSVKKLKSPQKLKNQNKAKSQNQTKSKTQNKSQQNIIQNQSKCKSEIMDQVQNRNLSLFWIKIETTSNNLGFLTKQAANNFINEINYVHYGLKQIKDWAILVYLGDEEQLKKIQQQKNVN